MKKNLFCLSALLCAFLVACGDDTGNKYPPPVLSTGSGGGGDTTTDTSPPNYYELCDESGGGEKVVDCCNDKPYLVDTCDPDSEQCPLGGVTCEKVVVCDCGEGNCFDLFEGCKPIE